VQHRLLLLEAADVLPVVHARYLSIWQARA
jgi:hypothetical protein